MWMPSICTTRMSRPASSDVIHPFMRSADSATKWREAADFEDTRCEDLNLSERCGESRRHDPDYLPWLAVERDGLADERRTAAEPRLPQLVADNADARPVRLIFVRREIAADQRHDAERREERCADTLAVQLLGIAIAREREVVEGGDADRGE